MKNKEESLIPAYSSFIYGDIYNNASAGNKFDSLLSARLRTFFQYDKLVASVKNNITKNQKVLQMGLVFGNEIDQIAQSIGSKGQYDIIDVNPYQVKRNKEKYGKMYACLDISEQDAASITIQKEYDVVICFLLLQELPPATKSKVINNALNAVKEGGYAIFVDYHNPLFWHPLRYVVRMYNRLYHPFVEKLWDREIDTFAKDRVKFIWRKNTFFGRMFQKVIATRKDVPQEHEALEDSVMDSYFLPDF